MSFLSWKGLEGFVCVCGKRQDANEGVEEGLVGEKDEWGQTGREGKDTE